MVDTVSVGEQLLLERGDQLAAIDDVLRRAQTGTGAAILIEGPAGIGKTAILERSARDAAAIGVTVLAAGGTELELEDPFGLVRELLQPAAATLDPGDVELLSPGASAALAALGIQAGSASPERGLGAGERRALVLQGLHELCQFLAARGPLAIVIDDLHWIDSQSRRWLAHLVRRLERMPVALLAATRTDAGEASNGGIHAQMMGSARVSRLRLEPLGRAAIERLISNALPGDPSDEFVDECRRLTGGNPFLLRALLDQAAEESIAPDEHEAERLRALTPRAVRDSLLLRIGRLSPSARALACATAALGDRAQLRDAAGVAALSAVEATEAAAELVGAGVLRDERALSFVHPLIAAAVYQELSEITRTGLHRQAANCLRARGRSSERVAAHLLLAESFGDAEDVATLRAAAASAQERGAPASAARYLRAALGDAGPSDRPGILEELGEALSAAADPDAQNVLEEAHREAPDATARSRISLTQSRLALVLGWPLEADRLVRRGLAELEGCGKTAAGGERLRYALEAWRGGLAVLDPTIAKDFERGLGRVQKLATGRTREARALQLLLGWRAAYTGATPAYALDLLDRGIDNGALIEDDPSDLVAFSWAARALIVLEQLDQADAFAQQMVAVGDTQGLVATAAAGRMWRACVALRLGDLPTAECRAAVAVATAQEHDLDFVRRFASGFLAEALHRQGRSEEALDAFAHLPSSPMAATSAGSMLLHTRALARLAAGPDTGAIEDLRAAGTVLDGCGFRNPNTVAWRSALALALPPEDGEQARRLAAEELRLARRCRSLRAEAVALRSVGWLAPDAAEAVAFLDQSVRLLGGLDAPLERAESLVSLGAALRRAGRRLAARAALADGRDLADRCGAAGLEGRAREELLATGAKPRRVRVSGPESLTPRERTVAELAAQGLSNRELASRLFVSEKTITAHLTRAFSKLGINSRRELATRLE